MSGISTATKAKVGTKAAKTAVKNPRVLVTGAKAAKPLAKTAKPLAKTAKPVAKFGRKAGSPLAKRRARRGLANFGDTVRRVAQDLVTFGPAAAQEYGLVEPPKPKRTAPRLLAGVLIGAAAVYFLEPEHGGEHRQKVMSLVS